MILNCGVTSANTYVNTRWEKKAIDLGRSSWGRNFDKARPNRRLIVPNLLTSTPLNSLKDF